MTRLRLAIALGAVLLVVGVVALIYHKGERAGSNKVTVQVERRHRAAVADARADERQAGDVAGRIAERAVRADQLTDTFVRQTIKDLQNAIDLVPPTAAGAALPPAPVDRLRDGLNAGIARANRAAEIADAAP